MEKWWFRLPTITQPFTFLRGSEAPFFARSLVFHHFAGGFVFRLSPVLKSDFSGKIPLANNTTETLVNLNENITNVLKALAEKEKKAGDGYRERAYRIAIKSISAYPKQITSGEEARKLRGIGNGISAKIDEILKTGTCSKLWENNNDERR